MKFEAVRLHFVSDVFVAVAFVVAQAPQCLISSPCVTCKRDQIKMRDYMDRRVTPPN